jgi:hypothetical protein
MSAIVRKKNRCRSTKATYSTGNVNGLKEIVTKQKQEGKVRIGQPNLVVGLTGPFGSGCGEMRKVLEVLGFCPFKISDDIRAELKGKLIERGKPNWRKVLQDHGNEMRKGSQDYWIRKVVARINGEQIGDGKIVIDG